MSDLLKAARKALPGVEWEGNDDLAARIDGNLYNLQRDRKRGGFVAFVPRKRGRHEDTELAAAQWLRAEITARRDALNAALGEDGWVPVGVRLPDTARYVQCALRGGGVVAGFYGLQPNGDKEWRSGTEPMYGVVFAWCDFAAPPKE